MKEETYKPGEWIEGDNGYGVVVKIIHRYYQYGDDDIPANNKVGDKKKDSILMKRFCSFDFKVRPQTRLFSLSLAHKISKKDMLSIKKLLDDEKVSKRFEKYQIEMFDEISNFSQKLSETKLADIRNGLSRLKNNGSLKLTCKEIESYLSTEFDIELFESHKNSNCYIQLVSDGIGNYRDRETLFKRIDIHEKG